MHLLLWERRVKQRTQAEVISPQGWSQHFHSRFPLPTLNLSFIPFQMRLLIRSHLFRMMRDVVSLQRFKCGSHFQLNPL